VPAERPAVRHRSDARSRTGDRPEIRLRPVRLADTELVLEQRRELLRAMDDVPEAAIDRYLPVFRRWFRRELKSGRLWGYVAEARDGHVVGGGLLWLQPRLPSPRFRHHAGPYIFSVYTEPDHRGRGVATQLVSALVDSAAARGYARVELHSTEMGRHLYERLGFEPTTQMRVVLADWPSARTRPGSGNSTEPR
jgi:ribosomal protein S18 acetylase RimI-like enzyme